MKIGPVAQNLLLENDDVKIWQVDTPAGETFWHHYHNFDYVLFHTTEMLGAVYNAEADHERIWRSRNRPDESLGAWCYEHSIMYIPGTGFLSPGYVNIGRTDFTAALIEVVRPRRPDQEGIGFARTDALVGVAPRPGSVLLLENDRLRAFETVLEPGDGIDVRGTSDTAVFVIAGSEITVGDRTETWSSVSGQWRPAGTGGRLVNIGSAPYRELSVELK